LVADALTFVLYTLFHYETRYVGPFFVVL
jgi:hypothetical protein